MERRTVLGAVGVGLAALAGCTADRGRPAAESPEDTGEPPGDASSLTDWERSTDCEGEYDGMHDSAIAVARVETTLADGYAPIRFSDLSPGERDILRTVTEDGGYASCDPPDAFHRFVDRVSDRTERQPDTDDVYLEREGTYYGLYVEVADQVYAH